ncbi:RidA family protein [Streptacidiphilus pinicola]|uniref:RidA family protein n=1 Tax=Streptacidiphilus pinicola TaxID=2219663 RepID=A0A2X0IBT1_9ACTN|nr:Rid family hydrolase [Streptacidiphilus pinicola]RAG82402.1 RidA family protein [Streptacidiphilus pinicola]
MTIQKINPDTIAPPHGHAQVVVATGSKLVFASGQVAIAPDEKPVGDATDYKAQGYKAVSNAYAAITASGASPGEVVRMTVYVVDPTAENLESLYAGLGDAVRDAGGRTTAMTLVGITGLSEPGRVVEIEMTAVTD